MLRIVRDLLGAPHTFPFWWSAFAVTDPFEGKTRIKKNWLEIPEGITHHQGSPASYQKYNPGGGWVTVSHILNIFPEKYSKCGRGLFYIWCKYFVGDGSFFLVTPGSNSHIQLCQKHIFYFFIFKWKSAIEVPALGLYLLHEKTLRLSETKENSLSSVLFISTSN